MLSLHLFLELQKPQRPACQPHRLPECARKQLCCAVLCCAVLCCAVVCCGVLCTCRFSSTSVAFSFESASMSFTYL
jgi:hypothetical protein